MSMLIDVRALDDAGIAATVKQSNTRYCSALVILWAADPGLAMGFTLELRAADGYVPSR